MGKVILVCLVVVCLAYGASGYGWNYWHYWYNCFGHIYKTDCRKKYTYNDCNTTYTKQTCMGVYMGSDNKCTNFCSTPMPKNCFCDPKLPSAQTCQPGLTCQSICYHSFCKYECLPDNMALNDDEVELNCTDETWQMVYTHDRNGSPLDNTTIMDLVDAVQRGAEVKVYTEKYGLTQVEKVTVHTNEDGETNVYAQLLFWSREGRKKNFYLVFSTEGNVHLTEFSFNADTVDQARNNYNQAAEMIWFSREAYTLAEDENTVARAIKDGATIRVSNGNETFQELDAVSSEPVQGYTTWEMRDILYGREFNVTQQSVFREWNYNGEVTTASLAWNTHDTHEYTVESGQDLAFYYDACWDLVYRQDEEGHSLYGSNDALIEAVEAGKRIKVEVDGVLHEVNVVRVTEDNEVIAEIFDNVDSDLTDPTWKWLFISSNGTVKTVEAKVGVDNQTFVETVEQKEVLWYADRRNWTTAASIDETGTYVDGSREAIDDAVAAGADFRIMVQDGTDRVYYDADAITPERGQLAAYHDRQLIADGETYLRRYSLVKTDGTATMHDYIAEDATEVASTSSVATASTWFIAP